MRIDYKVTEVNYHRNGIGGEGFYVCRLHDPEHGEMIAIAFSSSVEDETEARAAGSWINPCIAVFSEEKLPDVRFFHNSWRGDHYWPSVYDAIVRSGSA